jgi:hypothetical protein
MLCERSDLRSADWVAGEEVETLAKGLAVQQQKPWLKRLLIKALR